MRTLVLATSFALLVGLIYPLWQHRFEVADESRISRLSDWFDAESSEKVAGVSWHGSADRPVLRLEVDEPDRKPVHRMGVPNCGEVKFLHLRLRLRGDGIVPGKQIWEDGRLMIEWHRPGDDGPKVEAIASIRGDAMRGENFVVSATKGSAVPVLRLENLGVSGAFELQELELRELRETAWWRYGRWLLAAAWIAWSAALVRSIQKTSLPRAIGAATIFVTMGALAVVPGPWKIQRPFGDAFVIKEAAPTADASMQPDANGGDPSEPAKLAAKASTTPAFAGPEQALGKIPVQGGLLLKAKHYLAPLRPLLHALLIMMPTLAMIWLAGWRPALVLAVMLSAAIELAQIAFGYGFDRVDVTDLAYDALGIAAAMLTAKIYAKRYRALQPTALNL